MRPSTLLSGLSTALPALAKNLTIVNPILPGFHSDPSCIFVPELDETFFCASSSFLAFPGLPIHASRDLQHWNLVSNALSRSEQLPELAELKKQTGGIWAPTLRYRDGTFYLTTTLVDEDKPKEDASRWYNFILTSTDPFDSSSWSDPTRFYFEGYDTALFWDDDGQAYVAGAMAWQIRPSIELATIDVATGGAGQQTSVWNGTGGLAPEGPKIFKREGMYYLVIAEGGTGVDHMVTSARSRSLWGPYEANPANPILTNANTTEYFQAVGHADFFQDAGGAWWGAALSIRLDQETNASPMGRETVLFPVTWKDSEWPIISSVRGTMSAWELPKPDSSKELPGTPISAPDAVRFAPNTSLPEHFGYWYLPDQESYTVSPAGNPESIRLGSSVRNLTGSSQSSNVMTLLARRQVDTLFTYSVHLEFESEDTEAEAGVTLFVQTDEHIDFGIVYLASDNGTAAESAGSVEPHFRIRGETSSAVKAQAEMFEVPEEWQGEMLYMEIKAFNGTHYAFSAGPAHQRSAVRTLAYVSAAAVQPNFTGALVGTYVTSNGRNATCEAYVSEWKYEGQGQFRN